MSRLATRAAALAFTALLATTSAQAADFVVDALANSSSGGTGLNSVSLVAGNSFSVSVDTDDLWSAGALPRWSDADGLTGDRFATGSDESGEAAGTLIGANFGLHSQGNLSAAFGTLVGQIGSGDFFAIGTSFSGIASATGTLKLYYWDSNNGDNRGSITATINVVPEPETYALMLAGLGAIGFVARRRRA
jgi:hypothetical protein